MRISDWSSDVCSSDLILQARRREFGARQEGRIGRALRELVPRADGEAVVAAVDAVAHGCTERARDLPLVLDGELGDAASRIEPIGSEEGLRRADVEAAQAGAAMVALRRVALRRQTCDHTAEEQPGGQEIGRA